MPLFPLSKLTHRLVVAAEDERSRLSSPATRHERGRGDDDAAREAALEAEFDRERQRQRAIQDEQRRREEREYQRRLEIWERHERLVVVPVQCSCVAVSQMCATLHAGIVQQSRFMRLC